MRGTVAGATLVMVCALVTGCGGGSDDGEADSGGASAAAEPKQTWGPPETHRVTLRVEGSGSSQIGWSAGDSHFETATLPWKHEDQVTLEGAELKNGVQLYVTPQAVKGADGRFVFPACVVEVDGKTVDKNAGGESSQGCKYTLKGS